MATLKKLIGNIFEKLKKLSVKKKILIIFIFVLILIISKKNIIRKNDSVDVTVNKVKVTR